jgi:tetratricopeptide (TPR) repeat protein
MAAAGSSNGPAQTYAQSPCQSHLTGGYALLRQGDHRGARDRFSEAIRCQDGDAAAWLGLGIALSHLGEDRDADHALRMALERNPREKWAYGALGELAYRRDDMEGALLNWEKALEIDPGDAALRARVERIRREQRTEKDFNRDVTSHFSVKYEGREKIEAGRIVLRILEQAYGDIGRALSFYPDGEIAVILYSDRQFQEVTDAPGWSGGIYDGRIRVPIGGIERESPALRALLYHEYTHAVVRTIAPNAPAWLNEGLAQHFEGREISGRQRDELRRAVREGVMPSLRLLEGSFMKYTGAQAGTAYLISLSAVRYLIDDYGLYRARIVLDHLGKGADPLRAIEDGLLLSLDEFERAWKRSLE